MYSGHTKATYFALSVCLPFVPFLENVIWYSESGACVNVEYIYQETGSRANIRIPIEDRAEDEGKRAFCSDRRIAQQRTKKLSWYCQHTGTSHHASTSYRCSPKAAARCALRTGENDDKLLCLPFGLVRSLDWCIHIRVYLCPEHPPFNNNNKKHPPPLAFTTQWNDPCANMLAKLFLSAFYFFLDICFEVLTQRSHRLTIFAHATSHVTCTKKKRKNLRYIARKRTCN